MSFFESKINHQMSIPILSIQGVSKFYTNKTALDNISLEIPKGSIYGLLGPNGAGKTSLLRIINQITMADQGSVLFNGATLNKSHLPLIGYLPEERGLYKKQKVWDQLLYFAELRGLTRKQAFEKASFWLNKMALWEIRQKPLEELSKGMQQKIQFIVACIHDPELLILDEPFSGFDPVNAELLTKILLELKANGTSIVFSTHRMESVEQLCDHMAIIHQSKLVLDGLISNIKQQYANGRVQVLSSKTLNLNPALYQIHTQSQDAHGQFCYSIQTQNTSNNHLIQEIINQAELISFTPYAPSILDIFIQLVTQNND